MGEIGCAMNFSCKANLEVSAWKNFIFWFHHIIFKAQLIKSVNKICNTHFNLANEALSEILKKPYSILG